MVTLSDYKPPLRSEKFLHFSFLSKICNKFKIIRLAIHFFPYEGRSLIYIYMCVCVCVCAIVFQEFQKSLLIDPENSKRGFVFEIILKFRKNVFENFFVKVSKNSCIQMM